MLDMYLLHNFKIKVVFFRLIITLVRQGTIARRFIFGLLALAKGPMDSRSCVRPSVRPCAMRYLEIRASDFSETWHKLASWRG